MVIEISTERSKSVWRDSWLQHSPLLGSYLNSLFFGLPSSSSNIFPPLLSGSRLVWMVDTLWTCKATCLKPCKIRFPLHTSSHQKRCFSNPFFHDLFEERPSVKTHTCRMSYKVLSPQFFGKSVRTDVIQFNFLKNWYGDSVGIYFLT